jgi:hypothetical protein
MKATFYLAAIQLLASCVGALPVQEWHDSQIEWQDNQIPEDVVAPNVTAWSELEKRQSTSTWNPPAKLVKPLNEVHLHPPSSLQKPHI